MMKAAAIDRFGPPRVLKLRTLPVPEPGPGELLLALDAAGVGVWDAQIRKGLWATGKERFPRVLGTDGAGVVAALGPRVRGFAIGERVWAFQYETPKGGFCAQSVAVKRASVGRYPRSLDALHAGAAAVTALTALQGIDDQLRVRRGQTVLVFGASGAVGTLAVQFARRRGARVLGTASGRKAHRVVASLGAAGIVDPRRRDVAGQLRALAPDGLDAVLALAGGDALEACLDAVVRGGRVAYPNGVEPEPRARRTFRRTAYDAETGARAWSRLERAVAAARLRVPIESIYPLARAAEAHARVERGHVVGRVVLRIRARKG